MKLKFWPYKMSSKSCREIARGCNALRVYSNGRYKPRSNHILINWGNSHHTQVNWNIHRTYHVYNKPYAVSKASNKLSTLRSLHEAGVSIPPFTTSKQAAILWGFNKPIYCRTLLTSRSGNGIIVATTPDELVDAPLYTQGVDVSREFRVHVFHNEVLDFTEKKRRRDVEASRVIRNHDNGWVFCRGGVVLPDGVADTAIQAIAALALDFGGVDICVDNNGHPIVFEVNTAPGVEGTTLQKYIDKFRSLV